MNETQYYSATIHGEEVIGRNVGSRFYGIDRNGKLYGKDAQINLTPVKFVPQDAVVIEGGDSVLRDVRGFSVKEILVNAAAIIDAETAYKGVKMKLDALIAQLTPPKPRPEEPKPIYPKVTAICPCWSAPITWTLGADGNWHTCRNGKWENHAWESLSDTVVLSEGR